MNLIKEGLYQLSILCATWNVLIGAILILNAFENKSILNGLFGVISILLGAYFVQEALKEREEEDE